MPEDIRIGMIGAGQVGRRHMKWCGEIDGANVVAVCDLLPSSVEAAKGEFDIADEVQAEATSTAIDPHTKEKVWEND